MKLVVELPDLPDELAELLAALDREDGWDGVALTGRTVNAAERWADALDAAEAPWVVLDGLLPDEVAGQLADLEPAPRDKLLAHAVELLQRTASLELQCAAIDLALDRLFFGPAGPADAAAAQAWLAKRRAVLAALMPEAQRLGCRLCVRLRQPLPPPVAAAAGLTLRLLNEFGHPDCRLLLNVVVDELADLDPAAVLGPFLGELEVLRLRYEPALGVRLTPLAQQAWAAYLRANGYAGGVVFAPAVASQEAFQQELRRLGGEAAQCWRGE